MGHIPSPQREHHAKAMKQQDLVRLVHERMGHISLPRLAEALKQGLKTGTGLTLAAVKNAIKKVADTTRTQDQNNVIAGAVKVTCCISN